MRFVGPARWHVTLRFLGEVPTADIPPLAEALTTAAAATPGPLECRLGPGTGWFTGVRVLQLPATGVDNLAAAVRDATASLVPEAPDRPALQRPSDARPSEGPSPQRGRPGRDGQHPLRGRLPRRRHRSRVVGALAGRSRLHHRRPRPPRPHALTSSAPRRSPSPLDRCRALLARRRPFILDADRQPALQALEPRAHGCDRRVGQADGLPGGHRRSACRGTRSARRLARRRRNVPRGLVGGASRSLDVDRQDVRPPVRAPLRPAPPHGRARQRRSQPRQGSCRRRLRHPRVGPRLGPPGPGPLGARAGRRGPGPEATDAGTGPGGPRPPFRALQRPRTDRHGAAASDLLRRGPRLPRGPRQARPLRRRDPVRPAVGRRLRGVDPRHGPSPDTGSTRPGSTGPRPRSWPTSPSRC